MLPPASHLPVLLHEICALLRPHKGGIYLDATFGAGGYTNAILSTGAHVFAIDRDPDAILAGEALVHAAKGRLTLLQGCFGAWNTLLPLNIPLLDGIVLDIGVSSRQLDQAERGFSFRNDGPLDMRMSQEGQSACDLLREKSEEALADIFYLYGEERAARRIARAIVHDRLITPFTRTHQLADLVARLLPHKPSHIHPATRVFQALRIAVNDELGELERALQLAPHYLKPSGTLAIVTFHSLEDRIVKKFLAHTSSKGHTSSRLLPFEIAPPPPLFTCPSPQPILPSEVEIARNPRARSAKLRYGIRTSAPSSPSV